MSTKLYLIRPSAAPAPSPSLPYVGNLVTAAGAIKVQVAGPCGTGDSLVATYRGPVAALLEAGAVTADLLAPVQRGQKRLDEFGNGVGIVRRSRRVEVTRWFPLDAAMGFPGVEHWMVDAARQLDEDRPPSAVEVLARIQDDARNSRNAVSIAAQTLGAGIGNRRLHPGDVRALQAMASHFAAAVEAVVAHARWVPGQDLRLI